MTRSAEGRPQLSVSLLPVDSLTVTTLVDNLYDVFMPDQGPARRSGPGATTGRLPVATMAVAQGVQADPGDHGGQPGVEVGDTVPVVRSSAAAEPQPRFLHGVLSIVN